MWNNIYCCSTQLCFQKANPGVSCCCKNATVVLLSPLQSILHYLQRLCLQRQMTPVLSRSKNKEITLFVNNQFLPYPLSLLPAHLILGVHRQFDRLHCCIYYLSQVEDGFLSTSIFHSNYGSNRVFIEINSVMCFGCNFLSIYINTYVSIWTILVEYIIF